jgi:hypothetical protein
MAILPARAVVIRHDVPDSAYIALGSETNFPASGFITAASNGAFLGGTLIDARFVLTVAHIQGDIIPGITTFTIGGTAYVIAEQKPHPFFNATGMFENDINVLRLTNPVPNVTPARYHDGSTPELGSTATSIGYGETGTGLSGSITGTGGVRRGANNIVDAFGDGVVLPTTSFITDFDNPGNPLDSTLGSPLPLALEGTLALFDSGGGVYADLGSGPLLIGINSFVASRDANGNNDYGDLFGATRVGFYNDYIAANIPEPRTGMIAIMGLAAFGARPRGAWRKGTLDC